ncbi:degradation arginine-rich protein for mis-folding domain-containing protein [Ditylenchus destructor]|nr:degradation arginine-rich protein for mis-folding domain-containing protein [Ditylenchus destructor]
MVLLAIISFVSAQDTECEVCTDVLTNIMKKVEEQSASVNNQDVIRQALLDYCESVVGNDDRKEKLCFYIGAHKDSATSIVNDVVRPLSFPKPPSKVCLDLKAKDSQICDLKYDKPIDWDSLELEKMKVKQLKELLSKLGDKCKGCTEKSDYIQRINELKPKSEL